MLGLREPSRKLLSLLQGCTVGPFSHLITPGTQRKGLYHPHFPDVKTKAHKTLSTVTKLVGVRAGTRARVHCTLSFMLPLLHQAELASSS